MRLRSFALSLVMVAPLAVAPAPASACTTFQLKTADGRIFIGKSYDWNVGVGHALLNKRGVAKRGVLPDPKDRPAEWVSQHASLTFNQYGRELPNGGVNDAGLVVEIMWLQETVFPPRDRRPAVNELQWIQHQLDRYASVEEVVRAAPELRVAAMYGKVHYLVCDRSGACAAIEFLEGKLVATSGAAMVVNTLTNHTYAGSVKALRTYAGFGGKQSIPPSGSGSLVRFARASRLARQPSSQEPLNRALTILDAVRITGEPTGDITRWQIVYDLQKLRVSWRTTESPELKSVGLGDSAPGCGTPVTFADLNGPHSKLWRWQVSDNRALITAATKKIKSVFPPGTLEQLARYPSRLPCVGAARRK